ncbi:MAG: undecaprenyl-diphosphate phosphatase [Spirochaetes bacterium]|nr:undecaprenyl-diphosphate phosphatase [Spirochaetota bacterium]
MELLKVVIISIIQGITEFLPISSSGHIVLLKNLLNLNFDTTFDVAVHFGTLISIGIYYRKEIGELLFGVFQPEIDSKLFQSKLTRFQIFRIWFVFIIATLPVVIAGVLLKDYLDIKPANTTKYLFFVLAGLFSFTFLILQLTRIFQDKANKKLMEINFVQALIIGIFQSFALLPGISRSGSTIAASLITGLNKEDAPRFSFILGIPAILGASLLKVIDLLKSPLINDSQYLLLLLTGIIVSAVIGYFALATLIHIIKKGKFWYFSFYLIIPILISVYLGIR